MMIFRDRAELAISNGRESLDNALVRFIPPEGVSVFGMFTLPQRALKQLLSLAVLVLMGWLSWWWLDGKLRAHYLGNYNVEKQVAQREALKKKDAENAALKAELERIRAAHAQAEMREKLVGLQVQKAMSELAAKGTSSSDIDRDTINKIVREANRS